MESKFLNEEARAIDSVYFSTEVQFSPTWW